MAIRIRFVAWLCVVLGGATASVAQDWPRIVGPATPELALLRYKPRELDDKQFAALAKAIAETTKVESWPKITVQSKEGLLAVVDRVYDFFLSTRTGDKTDAMALTTMQLVQIIRDANNLKSDALDEGQELSIPPMVGRPQSVIPRNSTSPLHVASGMDSQPLVFSSQEVFVETQMGPLYSNIVRPPSWETAEFRKLGLRTAGDITLTFPLQQAQALADEGVGTIPVKERVNVSFLQSEPCLTEFPPSAYLAAARQVVQKHLADITKAAEGKPLVLVDYDFVKGHGAQVRHVVDQFLADLGAPGLRTKVVDFDLNPLRSPLFGTQHPLITAMKQYSAYLNRIKLDLEDDRANASDWLIYFEEPADSTVVPIAPYALQAAVGTHLESGAFLNLSWRGDREDKVMPSELEGLLKNNDVFAVVAAGNEQLDVMNRPPQLVASQFSNFVNVTNGTPDGDVCGSRTSEQGARVDLLTEGRSIDGAGKAVFGSSFASPMVATAAWLKHLIDGTPAAGMRKHLVAASSFLPKQPLRTVEAKGVFDPAKLLVGLGPHYVAADTGEVVEFTTMKLDLGKCGEFPSAPGNEAINDLVIYQFGAKFEVAVRTASNKFPHVSERPVCELGGTLSFTATLPSGVEKKATTPKEFIALVRQLRF